MQRFAGGFARCVAGQEGKIGSDTVSAHLVEFAAKESLNKSEFQMRIPAIGRFCLPPRC
jgi:hypothetical protein